MRFEIFQPQAIFERGGRNNQEDYISPRAGEATEADRLFIVCDGMGGHERGEVASEAVATTMSRHIGERAGTEPFTDQMLSDALIAAYDRLDSLDQGEAKRMGTTLTLLCLHRSGVTAAHIGDSRIYHVRPGERRILYASRDHSLVMDLYQAGEITRQQMLTHPRKNIITRAMGPGIDRRSRPDVVHIADVRPGDYFYLCSDGMVEQMEDDELLDLLCAKTSDEEKCCLLRQATAENKDNHSAYLIHVRQVTVEGGDDALPDDEATSLCNAMNIYRRRDREEAGQATAGEAEAEVEGFVPTVRAIPGEVPAAGCEESVGRRGKWPLMLAVLALLAVVAAAAAYFFLNNSKPAESSKPTVTDTVRVPQPAAPWLADPASGGEQRTGRDAQPEKTEESGKVGEKTETPPSVDNKTASEPTKGGLQNGQPDITDKNTLGTIDKVMKEKEPTTITHNKVDSI